MRSQNDSKWAAIAICGAIFLVALGARIAFLNASPDRQWPHSALYEGDAPLWIRYAQALRAGQPFELDLPVHPPGMAYLLAFFWPGSLEGPVGGGGFVGLKLLWCALGAAACMVVYWAARREFNQRAALLAALLSAASFALVVQSNSLNNEVPYTLLLVSLAAMTQGLTGRPTRTRLAVWSVMNGVAALIRVEHTLIVVLWAAWLAWRWKGETSKSQNVEKSRPRQEPQVPEGLAARKENASRRGSGAAKVIAGRLVMAGVVFFFVPLPWNIRAYRAIERFNSTRVGPMEFSAGPVTWRPEAQAYLHSLPPFVQEPCFRVISAQAEAASRAEVDEAAVRAFFTEQMGYVPRPISPYVFIGAQGPLAFALANQPGGDGGFSPAPLGAADTLNFADPRHLRLFQDGYRVGWENLSRPGEASRLRKSKMSLFANGWTQGLTLTNWPAGLTGTRRPVDQFTADAVPYAWQIALLSLGAIGVGICIVHRCAGAWLLIVIYKLLITATFFGYARQAVSVLPVFYLFVAVGLDTLLIGPIARRISLRAGRWFSASLVIVLAAAAMIQGARTITYDATGDGETAPQWGAGAFESNERLAIQVLLKDSP